MPVELFSQDAEIPSLDVKSLESWIDHAIRNEEREPGDVGFIFCSDEKLLEYNKKYLEHDYYTDVITFDYCQDKVVSGDIFVSVDRVRDNADRLNESFETELHRVMIHGVLHLCGHKDDTEEAKELIRKREDYYLALHSKSK